MIGLGGGGDTIATGYGINTQILDTTIIKEIIVEEFKQCPVIVLSRGNFLVPVLL